MEILQFIINNIFYIALAIIIIFILIGLFIANFSIDSYLKGEAVYLEKPTSFWGNTFEFAKFISQEKFNGKVLVKLIPDEQYKSKGFYATNTQTVGISEKVANENSIAGIAIILHEFGHARQHFSNPKILLKNAKLSKFVEFLGTFNLILLITAIILFIFNLSTYALIIFGLIVVNFIVAIGLKISTLKLEKDASRLAMKYATETKIFEQKELKQIKSFLNLAKKTYLGDLFCALLAWTGLTRRTRFFEK